MAGQAIDRRLLLAVTVHAEAHRQVHVALRHGLLADVAVARRALDLGADVRRVVELHVRRRRDSRRHALPRQVDALLAHLR